MTQGQLQAIVTAYMAHRPTTGAPIAPEEAQAVYRGLREVVEAAGASPVDVRHWLSACAAAAPYGLSGASARHALEALQLLASCFGYDLVVSAEGRRSVMRRRVH